MILLSQDNKVRQGEMLRKQRKEEKNYISALMNYKDCRGNVNETEPLMANAFTYI